MAWIWVWSKLPIVSWRNNSMNYLDSDIEILEPLKLWSKINFILELLDAISKWAKTIEE